MSSPWAQHRPTQAVIHLKNLAHNYKLLMSSRSSNYFFCPMVKANAYGHGDVEVARALESLGVKTLGVGLIEEGLLLRQMGIKANILVYGTFEDKSVADLIQWNLTPVVSQWSQLAALEKNIPHGKKIPVHLKFDTGMHRLGFSPAEAVGLKERFENHPLLTVEGVLTHLHSGENLLAVNSSSHEQLQALWLIKNEFQNFKPVLHALNSAAYLNALANEQIHEKNHQSGKSASARAASEFSYLDFGARPGLSIYGYNPVPESGTFDLRPVMSLRSRVVRYHHLKTGDTVSYGGTWRAEKDSVVGVVPAGYADGVHRLLSNSGEVLLDGQKVPIVGNVCMDYFMIDMTKALRGRRAEHFANQSVTLFGYDEQGVLLGADQLAPKAKTIPWEILTSISERVPRQTESL